ncbi:hypothetical protein F9U39_15840 [Pectobacterium versatile]|uniref:Uncharacterized protein n=1 Tax=Pectobacterium parvum TaxID=2778550 RepID=A0AAP9IEV7_9GAMM|nr:MULTISPECIES: hypothetical protein [Pectobacterium]MBQ4790901.1 hypothetical protein [Pectobacterium versatile]MBN3176401.1 hypothetical protein [Pectobacterium parmentieri]QHQ23407.1 hypothetical protein GMX10_04440 [Pectobacterium parvum]QRN28928.1 hypothetical protein IG623_16565 [Pectobacterium parmentieri]UEM39922.1 hypothetical protein DMB82_0002455 [Pectobacterium aquaticum]
MGGDRNDIFLKLKEIAFENGFNYGQSHALIELFNNKLQVIEPLPINQRVKNQQGLLLFSPSIDEPVFSKNFFSELNTIDGIEMSEQLDQNAACYKVVISYQFVDAIRKELERYGISRDFIYPELQNFTDYMKGKIINKYLN